MSEKVLGFKEKDAEYNEATNAYPKKDGGFKYTGDFHIEETKLVPVVSLEWLEKEIEKQKKEKYWDCILSRRVLDDFLEAAKLRAGEGK